MPDKLLYVSSFAQIQKNVFQGFIEAGLLPIDCCGEDGRKGLLKWSVFSYISRALDGARFELVDFLVETFVFALQRSVRILSFYFSEVILRKALSVFQEYAEESNSLFPLLQFLLAILSSMVEPGLDDALFCKVAALILDPVEAAFADGANAWIVNKPAEGVIDSQVRLRSDERASALQCDLVANLGDHRRFSGAGRALNKQEVGDRQGHFYRCNLPAITRTREEVRWLEALDSLGEAGFSRVEEKIGKQGIVCFSLPQIHNGVLLPRDLLYISPGLEMEIASRWQVKCIAMQALCYLLIEADGECIFCRIKAFHTANIGATSAP